MSAEEMSKALTGTVYNRMLRLRDDISRAIAAGGLRASGRTQQSLQVVVDGDEVSIVGRPFFPALQWGSSNWTGRTGVRCTFDEFRGIIRQWAADKGLNFGQHKEQERTVSAIAMSIIRRGTKVYRTKQYLDVYDTLIDEAVKDMMAQIGVIQTEAIDVVVRKWART